jgi:DNA-binding CsgD family transcriptional regulator
MAGQHARAALTTMAAPGWGVAVASPLAKLTLVNTMMGHVDQGMADQRQAISEATARTRFWLQLLYARGHLYLASDRLHAALSDFQQAGRLAGEWGLDFPSVTPWRGGLAEVYIRLGRLDLARELARAQLAMNDDGDGQTRGMSLRILASASESKLRVALLREAVDVSLDSGDQYELAMALASLSQAEQDRGEVDRARKLVRHALQLAKACHAHALYERLVPHRVSTEVVDTDVGEGLRALSTAERRVAALAARGYTNRQIGRKLYITESTVEQHLTRAYRKLKVNRRTDLPPGLLLELTDSA